jgi:hypothetical protein
MNNGFFWGALALGLLALLFLWCSHRANKKRRLMEVLPTSRTQGVFIGTVELKGTAETEVPFTAYLCGLPCVLYSWNVSEHWSRTVTETYTDSEGKSQTRTRTESGSTTVAEGGEMAPFYLQDDEGVILVHPEGAKTKTPRLFSETCTPLDPLYYGKGPAMSVAHSDHRRTFTEHGIVLHGRVFLTGRARERQDVVAPEIAAENGHPLLITTQTEEQVLKGYAIALWVWGVLGLVAAGVAGWLLHEWGWIVYRWPGIFTGAGIYAAAWAVTWLWMVYNSLVDARNRVRQGWSLIDVQLKRRHDLLPQLLACLEGLRSHEQYLQTAVTAMRTQLSATPPGVNGPDFHGLARVLVGVAEKYPELKTSGAFLALQRQLVETEQRIALARAYYNDVVTGFNTRIQVFPDVLLAGLTSFKARPLLAAEDFERATVHVHLAE